MKLRDKRTSKRDFSYQRLRCNLRVYHMMAAEKTPEWSDICYSLKDLLKHFALPLLVMVEEGYMLTETESLASGQLITIQSQEDVTHLKGSGSAGNAFTIPTKCPFKVKLVAEGDGTKYKGVKELATAIPKPKYVSVVSKGRKDLGLVKPGDRLKILLSERGPDGPTHLHFRNQRGKHLRLPVDFGGEFSVCAEDDNEHSLSDLCSKELPIFVKFVDSSKNSFVGESIGKIEVRQFVNETLVFASAKFDGKVYATAFPVTFDIKVRPVASARRNEEQPIDPRSEIIDLDSFREYLSKEKVVNESGYVCFAPSDSLKQKRASWLPDQTAKISETDTEKDNNPTSADKGNYEMPISTVDPKRKTSGFLSKVKSKFRGSKSEPRKPKQKRPDVVVVRDNGASSDGGDSGIYEEIPGETYVSMDVIDGVRRSLGAAKSNANRKRAVTRVQSSAVPPPLPENHPLERRHTVSAKFRSLKPKSTTSKNGEKDPIKERESFCKFYESMKKSKLEILVRDIEGVGEILRALQLNKYVKIFEENQIDGKLLVDLDEAVFKDMGLTPFDSRKLRKYVFGWRPDTSSSMRTVNENADVRNQTYNENFDARKWTEIEVESHLVGLGLTEFSRFCKSNQVNGDLLWDLVVDDEMISDLLKGKDRRLNVVKLKNYVTEGWRPKVTKKRANTTGQVVVKGNASVRKHLDDKKTAAGTDSKNNTYMSLKFDRTAKPSTSSGYLVPVTKKASDRPNTSGSSTTTKRRSNTPNSSASSCVESPRSVNSCKTESTFKSGPARASMELKTKSRLQAKVTYPKNSPYGKSDSKVKGQTSIVEKKPSLKVAKPNDDVKKVGAKKAADMSQATQKEGKTTGKQASQAPIGASGRSTAVSGSSGIKSSQKEEGITKGGDSGFNENSKHAPKRRFSWLSKGSVKSNESKAAEVKSENKAKKEEGSIKETVKTSGKDTKTSSVAQGKKPATPVGQQAKKSISDSKTVKDVNKKQGSNFSKQRVGEKNATAQGTTIQSPLIRNLKKQYEKEEPASFKRGEPLQRSGKNNSRVAVKRKGTKAVKDADENEQGQPPSSVAQLRKKFDGK